MEILYPIAALGVLGLFYHAVGALSSARGPAMAFTLASSAMVIIGFRYIDYRVLVALAALLVAAAVALRIRTQSYAAGSLLVAYLAVWFLYKYPDDIVAFVPSLAPLAEAIEKQTAGLVFLGVSYIGFKLIHLYVDYADGKIKNAPPLSVVAWLLFAPSLVAGPIHRYQAFEQAWPGRDRLVSNLYMGSRRIIVGLFKVAVLGASISGLSIVTLTDYQLSTVGWDAITLGVVCYTVGLYFNFAGYTDIAIGLGHFWNQRLPENFDFPFLRRNLQEFWKCWHMSLIEFVREYVFMRIVYGISQRDWFAPKSIVPAAIGLLATFLTAAVWHKFNVGYLLWGLTNAGGLIFVLYLQRSPLMKSDFGRWWKKSSAGYAIGVLLTFIYVNATCLFISLDDSRLSILLGRLA